MNTCRRYGENFDVNTEKNFDIYGRKSPTLMGKTYRWETFFVFSNRTVKYFGGISTEIHIPKIRMDRKRVYMKHLFLTINDTWSTLLICCCSLLRSSFRVPYTFCCFWFLGNFIQENRCYCQIRLSTATDMMHK